MIAPSPRSPLFVPRWVRLVDAVAALAGTLFLSALLFDGVRLRFGEVRLSASSPLRIGLIFLTIVVARHLLVRHPSWWANALARAKAFWADEARRAVWPVFWTTRVTVLVAAYFATVLIGLPGNPPRVSENEWNNLPARWDAMWYLGIAADGYAVKGQPGQNNLAFFPAYPMLMRAGGALLGVRPGGPSDPSVSVGEFLAFRGTRLLRAGLVISLWAFLHALIYLYRLGRDLLDERAARHAVVLIAAFPFAFFYSAAYSESLFLAGTLGAFYHFRRREWVRAAVWGLIVGLTRPNGCLLSLPLAWLAWSAVRTDAWRNVVVATAVAAAPGIGMLLYSGWLYSVSGDGWLWMQAQTAWGREFHGLGWSLRTLHGFLSTAPLYELTRYWPTETLDGVAAFAALALTWPVARRLGPAYAVLIPLTLVPPLVAGGFMSLGRMTATLFPLFLYLGWRLPDRVREQWVIASLLLQGALASIHFTWRPLV